MSMAKVWENPLILASQSPRRRALLEEYGYVFQVLPPSEGAETAPLPGELPPELVQRLARQKAADVAPRCSAGIVLGCDTVAACQGQILGKPRDREDAGRRMLRMMRGQEHEVFSGICLWRRPDDGVRLAFQVTRLVMDRLTDAHIDAYLDTQAWRGKAGAFGYQDGLDWVHIVDGEATNVVGLPIPLLKSLLLDLSAADPS